MDMGSLGLPELVIIVGLLCCVGGVGLAAVAGVVAYALSQRKKT